MAIKLKRSSTPGSVPSVSSLQLGELALNTYDGTIYLKKNQGGTEAIVSFTSTGFPNSNVGYLFDDGAGNLSWNIVDRLTSNQTSDYLRWTSATTATAFLTYEHDGNTLDGSVFTIADQSVAGWAIAFDTTDIDPNLRNMSVSLGVYNNFQFFRDGRFKTPSYTIPGTVPENTGSRYTLIDPGSIIDPSTPIPYSNLEWGYPGGISNGTSTVYIDALGNLQLPAGVDILDSSGSFYKGINVQDDTVPVSTSSQTLNFGTGLVVSVDPETNITSVNVDEALSNVSTLNVSGDISVGGNFTATGAIYAVGTVYSNGVPTLTSQFQADWAQADEASPAYINNKPTLITTILYTKQLNYVGTVTPGAGTLRWYPDSNIIITNVFVNASTPPVTTDLELDIKKNGSSIGTVVLDIGDFRSNNVSLNESLTTNDYITVDVIVGGLAAFATLTVSYTRVA
jgi:hypothetical protein